MERLSIIEADIAVACRYGASFSRLARLHSLVFVWVDYLGVVPASLIDLFPLKLPHVLTLSLFDIVGESFLRLIYGHL